MPDEVWNFMRGDGIEKALLLADLIIHGDNSGSISIAIDGERVTLSTGGEVFRFFSSKNLSKSIQINGNIYIIN